MAAQLNARRTYEYRITAWFVQGVPKWAGWERGTLQQIRDALQPFCGGADYAWQVRDPKTGKIISQRDVQDYWLGREIPA